MSGRVAVILASTGCGDVCEASVAGFLREVGERGEVVVVEGATEVGEAAGTSTYLTHPNLRILRSPDSRLVPELWRDGLRAVDADLVAFSTTQMVPRAGWLDGLSGRLDGTSALGVGGAIEAGDRLGPVDRAVYLQRFLAYGPDVPLPARPSGENAAYRRDRLMEVEDAWAEGFWEAEVHRRLEERGGTWEVAPGAVVEYAGSTRLLAMARQRVAHARRFGAVRASGRTDRWARGLATPLVPAVLLVRAGRGLMRRGMAFRPWLGAIPSFLLIAGAWAVGETLGAWSGHDRP